MIKIVIITSLLLVSLFVNAEQNVIYDNENVSKSMAKYNRIFQKTESIRSINKKMSQFSSTETPKEKVALDLTTKIVKAKKSWLPITTPELSFGVVEDREAYFPHVSRPFCVIGDDENSMKWIDEHFEFLKKINAYCWLVKLDSHKDIKRIYKHTAGLQVVPAQGTVLHKQFQINHYPILITSRRIMQ